jgi:hypothetical protein
MVLRQPDYEHSGLVDKVRIQLLAAETGTSEISGVWALATASV